MASLKLVALIFALLIGSFIVHAQKFGISRCGRLAHFENCGKPISCQRSCKHLEESMCVTVCTPTCVCNDGHVRNNVNQCVPINTCR